MAGGIRVDDLDDLKRRVVLPVVRCLLRAGELDDITLSMDAPAGEWPWAPEPGSVWVRVTARGETFKHRLVAPFSAAEPNEGDGDDKFDGLLDPDDVAIRLYDGFWEWLTETRFAWGEDREGEYVRPGADDAPR